MLVHINTMKHRNMNMMKHRMNPCCLAATGWHFICISPYECGEIFAKQDGEEQMDRQTDAGSVKIPLSIVNQKARVS